MSSWRLLSAKRRLQLTDPRYVGTALTIQTSLGFLLTLFTIRMIPPLRDLVGWHWAFADGTSPA